MRNKGVSCAPGGIALNKGASKNSVFTDSKCQSKQKSLIVLSVKDFCNE